MERRFPAKKMKILEGLIRRTAQDFLQEVEKLIPPPSILLSLHFLFPRHHHWSHLPFLHRSRPFMYRSQEAATYHRSVGRFFPIQAGITWLI